MLFRYTDSNSNIRFKYFPVLCYIKNTVEKVLTKIDAQINSNKEERRQKDFFQLPTLMRKIPCGSGGGFSLSQIITQRNDQHFLHTQITVQGTPWLFQAPL